MEEDECARMLDHLQQYVPHLEKLINQLKDPKRKNRELQLNKLEGLHSMITDRKKKLKLDTLKKCEDVILKILHKVNPNIYKQLQHKQEPSTCNMVRFYCKDPPERAPMAKVTDDDNDDINYVRFQAARARLSEIATPDSPSPPLEIQLLHAPIVIPTEKITNRRDPNPDDFQIKTWEKTFDARSRITTSRRSTDTRRSDKPDVYSQAAESLTSSSNKMVFGKLGTKVDMSKPPLSLEDLQQLTDPVAAQNLSMGELEDLRHVLQKKLQQSDEKRHPMPDLRNKLNKMEIKLKEKPVVPSSVVASKPRSPRVEKVFKDPDSKFGNLLSSIDEQILGDTSAKKDISVKKKDKKDHGKNEKGGMSEKHLTKNHNKKDHYGKKRSKDRHHNSSKLRNSLHDNAPDKPKSTQTEKNHTSKHESKGEEQSCRNNQEPKPLKGDDKSESAAKDAQLDKPSANINEGTQNSEKDAPIYKRLADKYNPRPRKSSTEVQDRKLSETTSKVLDVGQKIPVLESIFSNGLSPNETNPFNRDSTELVKPIESKQNTVNPWFNRNTANIEPPRDAASLLNSIIGNKSNSTLLTMLPSLQNKSVMNNPFVPNTQLGFNPNNQVMRTTELIPTQSQFVPTQQNSLNQNVSTGGNTYMNTFILQNNVVPTQFNNAVNSSPNPFHQQVAPNKAFHPFNPINNEYDLSQMQPQDFYSPHFIQEAQRPIQSPPGYANRSQYGVQYHGGREQPPYSTARPSVEWPVRSPHDREDNHRPILTSRDPRIRAREMKEKPNYNNAWEYPPRENAPREQQQQPSRQPHPFREQPSREQQQPSREHQQPSRQQPSREQLRRQSNEENSHNKYDSLYSNLDRDKPKETFISPLDSLYSVGDDRNRKCGKGYGVQKFRIPKKRVESDDRQRPGEDKDAKKEQEPSEKEEETRPKETVQEETETLSTKKVDEAKPSQSETSASSSAPEVRKEVDAGTGDQNMIFSFLTKLIQKSEKEELLNAIISTLAGGTESDVQKKKFKRIQKLVDSDSEEESSKLDVPAKVEEAETLSKLEGVEEQTVRKPKPADTDTKIKDPLEKEQKEEEIEEEKKEMEDEQEVSVEDGSSDDLGSELELEELLEPAKGSTKTKRKRRKVHKKVVKKPEMKKRGRKKKNFGKIEEADRPPSSKSMESVIETVGERIKSRRRNVKTPETPKSRKCRSELDMLHEDIKEMFIRDGVLTATGKRMCRMLKPDSEAAQQSESKSSSRPQSSLEEESNLDSPKRRARAANPKVVIEKTDFSKLIQPNYKEVSESEDEDVPEPITKPVKKTKSKPTRRMSVMEREKNLDNDWDAASKPKPTRRKSVVEQENSSDDWDCVSPVRRTSFKRSVKSKPNYAEGSDEEVPKRSASEPEEEEPEPEAPPRTETPTKRGSKKKKRGNSWASGVIKKFTKKKTCNSTMPTPSEHNSDVEMSPPETAAQDDHDSETEFFEPDVNYYFDREDKKECKICSFKGKMIVQHYKTVHPKYEVLISRLSPEISQKAIEESVIEGYEDVVLPDVTDTQNRKTKHNYQCRFCLLFFKNVNPEIFFDHLTSHTGEYRFGCTFCPFKTANIKSLRSHLHSAHHATAEQTGTIHPLYPGPPDYHQVFAYMCGECHYIQLDKSTVKTHMKIYHLGDSQKIHRIDASMTVVTKQLTGSKNDTGVKKKADSTSEEKETSSASEEKVDEQPSTQVDEPKSKEKDARIVQVPESLLVPKSEIPEIVPEKPSTPPPPKKPLVEPSIEVKQEEDPTVFKYNTDYVQESLKQDEQKHEQMKEINQTITPRIKPGMNFLDRIKNRLDFKVPDIPKCYRTTGSAVVTTTDVAENNVRPLKRSSIVADSPDAKKANKSKTTFKSILDKTGNKVQAPITGIIERLQGKLQPPLPPLTPLNEYKLNLSVSKVEEPLIQVGPVAARRKSEFVLYICYMQSCIFSSRVQADFLQHCEMEHGSEPWDGICSVCQKETGGKGFVDAFNHLISAHKSDLELTNSLTSEAASTSAKEVCEQEGKPFLRMRRLSGDKLSELRLETDTETTDGEQSHVVAPTMHLSEESSSSFIKPATVAKQPKGVVEASHNFPFQILDVVSLAAEDEESNKAPAAPAQSTNLEPVVPSLTIINSATAAGGLTTVAGSAGAPIAIPIPVSSTGVGAFSFVVPMLPPVKKQLKSTTARNKYWPTGKVLTRKRKLGLLQFSPGGVKLKPKTPPKKIILKDTPLTGEEIMRPRKTPYALTCLLAEHKLIHLYKCPERTCTFSTDSKKSFEAHLLEHTDFRPGVQIPCLYCNFKTDFEFFGVHYDIRHGRCQFCCAYCLYRAKMQSYVQMHQEKEHSGKVLRVLRVPANRDALMSQAQIGLMSLRNVVPPYVCGQLGCESKFIFPETFKNHLQKVHKGIPLLCSSCQVSPRSPDNAIQHMQTHNVYHHHCRYCSFGAASFDEIHKHLANQHFAMDCQVVVRQFKRDRAAGSYRGVADYSYDDDEIFDCLKIVTNENPRYVTASALIEIIPLTGVTKPSKTYLAPFVGPKPVENAKNDSPTQMGKITLKILEQRPMGTKTVDDGEIVHVSDDESSPSGENAVVKQVVNSFHSQPPIVLNQFLKMPPTDLLNITKNLPHAEAKLPSAPEASKSPVVATSLPTELLALSQTLQPSTQAKIPSVLEALQIVDGAPTDPIVQSISITDFVGIQPEADVNSEEASTDAPTEIDPLQLESEACTALPDEINPSVKEPEAKMEATANFGFTDDGEEFSDLTAEEVVFSADDSTKKQNLGGRDLFRCGFCKAGFESSSLFKTHVVKCVETNKSGVAKPYKCAHCLKAFKTVITLLDHVRLHGTQRFSCSLCNFKHQHQLHVRSHMKTRHKITSVVLVPVDPNKRCLDEDEYTVRPKFNRQKSEGGRSKDLIGSGNLDEFVGCIPAKGSYGPDEIDSLPIRPIFTQEVKCSACGYVTKVRANLVRHLQFHTTGKEMPLSATAPVNPVPCLEKNEKMFDKMTNLSLSSYNDAVRMAGKLENKEFMLSKEEEAKMPRFVPSNKRYVCGASSCNYLCLEEAMLKYHWKTLHSDERTYKCMHCEQKLAPDTGTIDLDHIIKHLRLHDLHLFKCRHCDFIHHKRPKVDKHVLDKHPDLSPIVIVVRKMDHEPEDAQHAPSEPEEVKESKPWRCSMCKYRCANKREITAHTFNKHDVETQFTCVLCQFRSNERVAFPEHFELQHPGQAIDVIDAYYEVKDKNFDWKNFDTTPLWQREKTTFRHIRGIPVDETNKAPKKSPAKGANLLENLEKSIEAVASGAVLGKSTSSPGSKSLSKKFKSLKERKIIDVQMLDDEVIEIVEDDDSAGGSSGAGQKIEKQVPISKRRASAVAKDNSVVAKAIKKSYASKENHLETASVEDGEQLLIESSRTPPVVDEDPTEISLKDIQEMDVETLESTDLSGTYGPFGKPMGKQYLCPLCSVFKTRKVEDITYHLYKELEYSRFVCTNCGAMGVTHNFLRRHSVRKHITESIHPLSPNPRIESWVEKVLAIQCRIMEDRDEVTTTVADAPVEKGKLDGTIVISGEPTITQIEPKKAVSSTSLKMSDEVYSVSDSSSDVDVDSLPKKQARSLHQCMYCEYSCKAASDMRKHEKRHWQKKPFSCGHCDLQGVTKNEIYQHSKRAHPSANPIAVPNPIPSVPVIKPINRKRKYAKSAGDKTTSTVEETAAKTATIASSSKDTGSSADEPDSKSATREYPTINEEEPQPELEPEDTVVFVCNYCPKRCETESETRAHWEITHKTRQPIFKFRKVMRSQLIKKGTINYRCCHCEFVGVLEAVKKHSRVQHPKLAMSVFRYKCGYCKEYLKNVDKSKVHFKQSHDDAVPAYLNIEGVESDDKRKDFPCEHCSAEFVWRQGLTDHHKAMHSHLALNLAPTLSPQVRRGRDVSDEEGERMKRFMCPECSHRSDSYASIRDHLRAHAKPFQCFYCPLRYTYPSFVRIHQTKEHPDKEYKHLELDEGHKLNVNLRKKLLCLNDEGVYVQYLGKKRVKSDLEVQPRKLRIVEVGSETGDKVRKFKETARKSTTHWPMANAPDEGYSYYGQKPDLKGIENVKSTLPFMQSLVTMHVTKIKGIIDIFPTVPLVDVVKYRSHL